MLFIDDLTESKLVTALETLKADPKTSRCIYFKLQGHSTPSEFKDSIFERAQHHFATIDAQIFLCGDGDIFILAPSIPVKDGREFILSIAAYLKRPASEEWVGFHEVSVEVNKLLLIVEQKLELQREVETEKRKLIQQQRQESKRQSILNASVLSNAEEVKRRRTGRMTTELMIIEDDAFSRRLVENVLQQKYSLTGLGEATHALSTYARIAPDVLFLDINLPDVTGHELLEKILKLDPDAYVIMLSGNADQANILQAMSKGAKGFIAKPFSRDKLFQYIERCPTIKQLEKEQ